MNNVLINKNGNLKRLPNKFFYDLVKFENYYYSKELQIYVKVGDDVQLSDIVKGTKCNSLDLLFECINLWKRLEPLFSNFPSKLWIMERDYFDDNPNYIDDIIKFCKRNGYPYADMVSNISNMKKPKLFKNTEFKETRTIHFRINDFLISLNDVHSMYLMYNVIVGNQKTITTPTYISTTNSLPISIKDLKNISNLSMKEYETIFENKYNALQLKSIIAFDEQTYPYIATKANNMFEAVAYQIALMIYNPELEIRICPICKEIFEPLDSRQKYCNKKTCYPQLKYKRQKSAEKKRQKNKPESI